MRTMMTILTLTLVACGGQINDPNDTFDTADTADTDPVDTADTADTDEVPCTETDADGDGWTECDGDCDDNDATIHPNTVWYRDADGDGYGVPVQTRTQCEQPAGWSLVDTDCDDTNPDTYPGADEIYYNDINDGCRTGWSVEVTDRDQDGDGFPLWIVNSNGAPQMVDCNDTNPAINPAAVEDNNNGIDDNCNGIVDGFGVDIWFENNRIYIEINDVYRNQGSLDVECLDYSSTATVSFSGSNPSVNYQWGCSAEETVYYLTVGQETWTWGFGFGTTPPSIP
jgi:hypothetical protein